jgi:PBP1b-binding outer membrane lipoprotein LpoB
MTRILPRVCSALTAVLLITGCQTSSSKSKDDGKTYTPAQKGSAAQVQSGNQSGQQINKPLNSPADTVNGMASTESDNWNPQALKGQVVAEPGAPVEHEAKPAPKAAPAPAQAPN